MLEEEIIIIEDDTEEEIITLEENIEYIEPTTQEKTITPTKEEQVVIPDDNIFALSKVTIEKIPDEYIIPNGEISITENGIYNVTENEKANVNVQPPLQAKTTTENGTVTPDVEYYGLSSVEVNVPIYKLGTKTITKNGTYIATDDGLDGYSQVEVSTSGVDINNYFLNQAPTTAVGAWLKKIPTIDVSKITSLYSALNNCTNLEEADIINTQNITNMGYMHGNNRNLTHVNTYNTSKVTNMNSMHTYNSLLTELPAYNTSSNTNFGTFAQYCTELITITKYNASKCTAVNNFCVGCGKLVNFGGLENLGEAYLTTQNANYSLYGLDLSTCTALSHDSLMNVINNLYDIATKGVKPQKLTLGETNLAKLTEAEINIATTKGWTVL